MSSKGCVLLVGGGNGAHVFSALATSKGHKVNILTNVPVEITRWQQAIDEGTGVVATYKNENRIVTGGSISKVSSEAATVVPDATLVILALPTFAHEQMLIKITPYLQEGATVVAVEGGWWTMPRSVFGSWQKRRITFGLLDTLPWATRISSYAESVDVYGASQGPVSIATSPRENGKAVAAELARITDIQFTAQDNLLFCVLQCKCHVLHPAIMYALWKDWTDETYKAEDIPLFYQGMTEETEQILDQVDKEVLHLAKKIEQAYPDVKLSGVMNALDWGVNKYGDMIGDKTSLRTADNTNKAYSAILAPMDPIPEQEGLFTPQFQTRYLNSDVPFGLVAMIGIAHVLSVPMTFSAKIVLWAQDKLGKVYLTPDGSPYGKDIPETRAPQALGITTPEQLIENIRATY